MLTADALRTKIEHKKQQTTPQSSNVARRLNHTAQNEYLSERGDEFPRGVDDWLSGMRGEMASFAHADRTADNSSIRSTKERCESRESNPDALRHWILSLIGALRDTTLRYGNTGKHGETTKQPSARIGDCSTAMEGYWRVGARRLSQRLRESSTLR